MEEEIEVKEFITEDSSWNVDKLKEYISEELIQHINDTIKPHQYGTERDKAWWMTTSDGKFSVKDAHEVLRKKRRTNEECKLIWNKILPTKLCFFYGELGKEEYLQMTILLN